jgi:hypothetical protein
MKIGSIEGSDSETITITKKETEIKMGTICHKNVTQKERTNIGRT